MTLVVSHEFQQSGASARRSRQVREGEETGDAGKGP